MFYFESKRAVLEHLIAGAAFALVIFGIIFMTRYSSSLEDTVKQFDVQKNNYKKIEKAVVDIGAAMDQMDEMIPDDYFSKSHREFILAAIRDIKSTLSFAEVKLIDFTEQDKEIVLPIEILFPVEDYTIMTESIAYVQSFKFPYFIFDDISVERAKDSADINCKILGSMRMPVQKLRKR
jgi:CHAT domain-containing protein